MRTLVAERRVRLHTCSSLKDWICCLVACVFFQWTASRHRASNRFKIFSIFSMIGPKPINHIPHTTYARQVPYLPHLSAERNKSLHHFKVNNFSSIASVQNDSFVQTNEKNRVPCKQHNISFYCIYNIGSRIMIYCKHSPSISNLRTKTKCPSL